MGNRRNLICSWMLVLTIFSIEGEGDRNEECDANGGADLHLKT